jgi:hypothetical protein
MIGRAALLASLFLVAGCGGSDDGATSQESEAPQAATPAPPATTAAADERIECALGGAQAFERTCTVDQETTRSGLTLTVRAPDGSFRRLLVTRDGRGVVAADGALPARVTPLGADRIEVAIAGDRYRLPATVRR